MRQDAGRVKPRPGGSRPPPHCLPRPRPEPVLRLDDHLRPRLHLGVARRLAQQALFLGAERPQQLQERQARLVRTNARIAGLVQFIADGDRSAAVVSGLHDLEAQAKAEKTAIADLELRAEQPIRLPTPEEIVELAFDLQARLAQDPEAGREWLRRILKGEKLVLEPQPDGVYVARGELLPLILLRAQTETAAWLPKRRFAVAGARFELATFGL
ncbi:MAG TPA: hypothetical protein VGQ83_07985 [Polyangia bacterium]|jgi:hypothetical protein